MKLRLILTSALHIIAGCPRRDITISINEIYHGADRILGTGIQIMEPKPEVRSIFVRKVNSNVCLDENAERAVVSSAWLPVEIGVGYQFIAFPTSIVSP